MLQNFSIKSFNQRSSTDTDMISSKVLFSVALVCVATVSADGWSQRSNLIDLGTSVQLPWESTNGGRLRNPIYRTVPNSEISQLRNIENQNLIGKLELQQLRKLGRISNENENRNQYRSQDVVESQSQQNSLSDISNGYTRLGAYSTFSSGPTNEQRQELGGNARQVPLLHLNQRQNYELKRIPTLASVASNAENELRTIWSSRLNKYNQQSNLRNSQQETLSRRLVGLNKLISNDGEQNQNILWNVNQEPLVQRNIQQNVPYGSQRLNTGDNRGQILHSLRSLSNQQIYRPVVQQTLDGSNLGEQAGRTILYEQEPSLQIRENVEYRPQLQILPANLGVTEPQNQPNLNQEQRNVYTYSELSAKIWNVIKSNPAMLSNLGNLREQLQNDRNPDHEQIRQLKGLLQEARQYGRNVVPSNGLALQSPEESQQNNVVATLIDAMDSRKPAGVRSTVGRGIWGTGQSW